MGELPSPCSPVYMNEDSARGEAGKSKTQDGDPQEDGRPGTAQSADRHGQFPHGCMLRLTAD